MTLRAHCRAKGVLRNNHTLLLPSFSSLLNKESKPFLAHFQLKHIISRIASGLNVTAGVSAYLVYINMPNSVSSCLQRREKTVHIRFI